MSKVIFVGMSGCGKSSLVQRMHSDTFGAVPAATISVGFYPKEVNIVKDNVEVQIKLSLQDTAGQEAFNSVVKSYYRNANVVILVFDVSDISSFQALNKCYMDVHNIIQNQPDYVLVGAKSDLKQRVTSDMISEFTHNHGCRFFSVSSISGDGIDAVLLHVAMCAAQRSVVELPGNLVQGNGQKMKNARCC